MASGLSFSVERILGNTHSSSSSNNSSSTHHRRSLSYTTDGLKFTFPTLQPPTDAIRGEDGLCHVQRLPTPPCSPPLSTTSEPSPLMDNLSGNNESMQ